MSNLAIKEPLEEVEKDLLSYPQVDCPVYHHFGPGIYIREVHLPAGSFAIGHRQKTKHLNIMLTGSVAMVNDGKIKVLNAPLMFVGDPGRKCGFILEDTIWQNIYATEETDIEKLEGMYLDKSVTFQEIEKKEREFNYLLREEDREDYKNLLTQIDYTEKTVREQSENTEDMVNVDIPPFLSIRDSDIEGKGIFLSVPVKKESVICVARIGDKRTFAGRYTNHSKTPNCYFKRMDKNIYLVAKQDIDGCKGGSMGEELTVDYRQSLQEALK